MASEIGICKMALSHLGERTTITSITPPDGSVNADHCALFYPQSVLETIEAAHWAFATKRQTLTPVASTIEAFEFAYALPADYIAANKLVQPDSPDEHPSFDYLIEGSTLYCNVEEAVLVYRWRPEPVKFTPHFALTVSYRLAAFLAGPITKSMKTSQAMLQMYVAALEKASTIDARSSRNNAGNKGTWRPSWLAIRRR